METKTIRLRYYNSNTDNQSHITIINQLGNNNNLPNNQIDISDENRTDFYTNQPYIKDSSAVSIFPGEGVVFAPYKNSTLAEHKRLGMNNAGNAALIKICVHAAIKDSLMHLYIGEHSKIKFGDTISFDLQPDGHIKMKHNAKKLETMETHRITKIIGYPKNREKADKEPLLLILANSK